MYGNWLKTFAVVVGSVDQYATEGNIFDTNSTSDNSTNVDTDVTTSSQPSRSSLYCSLLNYTTENNEPVASVSDYPSDCSTSPSGIAVGHVFEIRYNPENPKEFIKQAFFKDEVMSLSLMIVIGFCLTGMLLYFICRVKPDDHDLHQHSFDGFGGSDEEMGQPPETPEERQERIRSKMIFQTVREDLSNTTAEKMRALETEESTEEDTDVEEEQATKNTNSNNKSKADTKASKEGESPKQAKDDISDIQKIEEEEEEEGQNDNASSPNIASLEEQNNAHDEHHPGSGLLQMFSSWRRGETECCICLDKYEYGETICASKNPECTHVFHKDCVMDWLMKNHNQCPLCRTDLLK